MIRQWYDVFKKNKDLVEIRIIDNNLKRTYSGYFTDIEIILKEIRRYDNCNIYFTLNAINHACYSREQHDKIVTKVKATTSDNDIVGRDWCLIDIDVEKPSDTNSTNEEKELAKPIVNDVYKFLRDQGFGKMIICDSANGFHILVKQAMASNNENTSIMKNFLQVLDMLFSTDKVKIDCSTFNSSRICKLYGCISRKGSNTEDRPQRESKILKVPDGITPTPNEYFQKIALMLPKPETPSRGNNYSSENFNLDEFISKYHIKIRNIVKTSSYTKYILDECPFNSAHSAPDSAIFELSSGGYGFKCLHASCSQYTWKDFRLKYNPTAYDKKDYYEFKHKQQYYSRIPENVKFIPKEETTEKGKKWLSMKDIKYVDISSLISLSTGFEQLDKKIVGLMLGDVTVLSGLSASGKSSFIDCVVLNIIQKGYKAAVWSGELQSFRFQGWINQIAAGKNYVKKKEGYDNYYYAPKNISEKINEWLDGKLFLYNNEYGSKWEQLFSDVKELVEKENVQLICLDNLMALQIDGYDGDKYSKQTRFINDIKEYAKAKNIHIILVAHPRKENGFLRKESISGTADLTNLADNVIVIHRVSRDFETRAAEFLGKEKVLEYTSYSSVIEVCKNRSLGIVDYLVGLHYENESRRLKSTIPEHIIYGWQEQPIQSEITFEHNVNSFIEPNESFFDESDDDKAPF